MKEEKLPKIVLTGGHLSPLLAVLKVLRKNAECVVIGRKYTFEEDKTESLEYKVLREEKVPFYDLRAGRLQRKITKHTIPSLIKAPRAFFRARSILKREKPEGVLTFGGYVGLPVSVAAYSLGIPVFLHEQTQQAGLTNKTIAKFATRIFISFPSSLSFFPSEKTIYTGNPLRNEVFKIEDKIPIPKNLPVLFVTGGSTGAHAINTYVEYLLPKLLSHFVVIHQTGDSKTYHDFERLTKLKYSLPKELQERYILRKFIMPSEIGWVYSLSSVVLSRAGANTVSELLALEKKALLIPLHHGQRQEQLMNARFYEESGFGTFIEQDNVELSKLLLTLLDLEKKKIDKRKKQIINSAAEKISELTLDALKNN